LYRSIRVAGSRVKDLSSGQASGAFSIRVRTVPDSSAQKAFISESDSMGTAVIWNLEAGFPWQPEIEKW
jgi:hypothetical protein